MHVPFGGLGPRLTFCLLTELLYATAAWIGAMTLIILDALGIHATVAAWAGILACLTVRLIAIRWKVTLPRFHP